jgi:type IV pilus assembly protein PilM
MGPGLGPKPRRIRLDSSGVNLEYQVMEDSFLPPGSGQLDVLLVAAKKDKVQDYTAVISQAGCVPIVLDVDAFVLQYASELSAGVQPGRVQVLVNSAASSINLNVVQGRQSMLTRDVAIEKNAYSKTL